MSSEYRRVQSSYELDFSLKDQKPLSKLFRYYSDKDRNASVLVNLYLLLNTIFFIFSYFIVN